jgi:uncharacterized DUF497 family protein
VSVFEWDEAKAKANQRKHGVSFEEARSVFDDDYARSTFDLRHSTGEDRFMIVGYSDRGRMLAFWHTYRDSFIRIIGARLATAVEHRDYEEINTRG